MFASAEKILKIKKMDKTFNGQGVSLVNIYLPAETIAIVTNTASIAKSKALNLAEHHTKEIKF